MSALIGGKTAAWRSAFLGGNCADCVLQLAANFAHLGGGDPIEKRECNRPRSPTCSVTGSGSFGVGKSRYAGCKWMGAKYRPQPIPC